MRYAHLILISSLLAGCSLFPRTPSGSAVNFASDSQSVEAQNEMCVEENIGVFRFSRAYVEEFCPLLKSQLELVCFRFLRATKEWRKACPGIDTPDKLECISTIQNGPSYALLESLQKCKMVQNRKQVYCMSRAVSKAGVPLQPETVQECLDKNLN